MSVFPTNSSNSSAHNKLTQALYDQLSVGDKCVVRWREHAGGWKDFCATIDSKPNYSTSKFAVKFDDGMEAKVNILSGLESFNKTGILAFIAEEEDQEDEEEEEDSDEDLDDEDDDDDIGTGYGEKEEEQLLGGFYINTIYKVLYKKKILNVKVVGMDNDGYYVRHCKKEGQLFDDQKKWHVTAHQIK